MRPEENVVARKTETIRNTFQWARNISLAQPDLNSLCKELDTTGIEFRSVAYEAASMNIALADFKKGNELSAWKNFLSVHAMQHATQVHIGLGWALAQERLDASHYMSLLDPMLRYRVMDGYGYYEGMFRQRKSMANQQRPQMPDHAALKAYDQGLGRSMWYIFTGNADSARKMIEKFPANRLPDLWRGLGIACTYVGGCDEKTLKELFNNAGAYKAQLAAGAVMLAISRVRAGYVSESTELTCQLWCNRNVEELANEYQPHVNSNSADYSLWVSKIEASF